MNENSLDETSSSAATAEAAGDTGQEGEVGSDSLETAEKVTNNESFNSAPLLTLSFGHLC